MSSKHRLADIAATLILLIVISVSAPLEAQSFFGAISGTVTDSSGASVADATVTVTNIGTNEKHSMKTDATGNYRIVDLVPAAYRVEVESAAFKRFIQESATVQVNSTLRVDAKLQVGAATETIEVTTQPPLLQTDSGTVSSQVEGKVVQQMPLNGRNVMNLLAITPGVIPEANTSGSAMFNAGNHSAVANWGGYSISGAFANYSAVFLDGGPVNILGGNSVGLILTQDAVQEFQVQNSVPSAEFGRFGGGVITMASKSGANAFHGSVYEYLRNTVLNANYFLTKASNPNAAKAAFHQSQYGAMASGPIKKDKAFFFFSFEDFRLREAVPVATNVPGDGTHGTTDMVHGVFADHVNGKAVTIADPAYTLSGGKQGCNITHNIAAGTYNMPASCFDPTSVVMQGYSPGPNTSVGSFNFVSSPIEGNTAHQYNARIDQNISSKQQLFGRYTYWNHFDLGQNSFYQYTLPFPTAYSGTINHNHSVVIGDTYAFNPTTVLDTRVSYLHSQWTNDALDRAHANESTFGPNFARLAAGQPGGFTVNGLPNLQFSGLHSLYNYAPIDTYQLIWWENYAIDASLTKIIGNHTLKLGVDANRRLHSSAGLLQSNSGLAQYSNSTTGDEYASFLLGEFTSDVATTDLLTSTFEYAGGAYVTDTWRVNRNLTLNLGLRDETPGGIEEKKDRTSVLLPNTVDPVTGYKGTIAAVNSPLYPSRSMEPIRYDLFSPRVSFANRIGNSSVVKGGFGFAWLPYDMASGLVADTNPVGSATTTSINVSGAIPTFFQQNPWPLSTYPKGLNQPAGHQTTQAWTQNYLQQTVAAPVPSSHFAYMEQYNLAFSHQWRGDFLTDITWAGSKGTHLVSMGLANGTASFPNTFWSLNQLSPQYYSMGTALSTKQPCAALGGLSVTVGQCLRPYPQFTGYFDSAHLSGSSRYNGLYITTQKRFHSGGVLNVNYSFTHMVSDTDQGSGVNSYQAGIQDFTNPAAEKSLDEFDLPHRLNISYVVPLPFGKGQAYLNGGGVASAIAGGWSVNGVMFWQSGFPLPITYNGNALTQNFGAGTLRPNYTAGCDKKAGVPSSGYQKFVAGNWFNAACFTFPGNYSFGNEPRVDPDLRGVANQTWDFALQKVARIKERADLQFRMEFFNLFNHTNFPNPGSEQAGSSYNQIPTASVINPRLAQASLRLSF